MRSSYRPRTDGTNDVCHSSEPYERAVFSANYFLIQAGLQVVENTNLRIRIANNYIKYNKIKLEFCFETQ